MSPFSSPRASRGLAATWGSTPAERSRPYPCDKYLAAADAAYFRAVTVKAAPATVYRWLCQLRVAPYAYDWLDNGGHRSPRQLTPGLDTLAPRQRVMTIFEVADYAPNHHLTLVLASRSAIALFGEVALTYLVTPVGPHESRLVAKMIVRYPRRGLPRLMRWLLPWGDLLMMRKQLLTLKELAESQGAQPPSPWPMA